LLRCHHARDHAAAARRSAHLAMASMTSVLLSMTMTAAVPRPLCTSLSQQVIDTAAQCAGKRALSLTGCAAQGGQPWCRPHGACCQRSVRALPTPRAPPPLT
jgi:hypothetical protein